MQDLSGERLENAPEVTANVGVEYRSVLAGVNGLEWFARGDASFRSDHKQHVAQSDKVEQGSYTLYSARAGFEPLDGQWRLTVWGKNIFDKEYAVTARHDVAGVNRWQGAPRTYGVTADWYF